MSAHYVQRPLAVDVSPPTPKSPPGRTARRAGGFDWVEAPRRAGRARGSARPWHGPNVAILEDRRGRIALGYEADLLVLPDGHQDPYTALVEAEVGDIALLICAGLPVYGDVAFHSLFEHFSPGFTPVLVSGTPKLVAGDLVGLLDRLSRTAGREIAFPFLPCTAPSENITE